MIKITSSLLLLSLLLLSSCATREEIERRERLQQLSEEMETAQKLNSDAVVRLAEIEERLGLVSGKIEETAHNAGQTYQMRLTAIEQKISTVEEQSQHAIKRLDKLEKDMGQQQKYLEEVLSTLSSMSGKKSANPKKGPNDSQATSPFDQAMADYQKGKYDDVYPKLQGLLDDKSVKGNNRARVLHNLGMIEYNRKKYDDSMTYFSKMLTDHPKSPYNANGLLYLGKAFQDKGNPNEAQQAWGELIKQYPKHKHAATAKNLLKGL